MFILKMLILYRDYVYREDGAKLKMISNRKSGPGSLTFTAYESIKVNLSII